MREEKLNQISPAPRLLICGLSLRANQVIHLFGAAIFSSGSSWRMQRSAAMNAYGMAHECLGMDHTDCQCSAV